jgi:hypothetical protein
MKIEHVKKGMKVIIDKNCRITTRTCTLIGDMLKYLGSIQTVDDVSYSSVQIRGFNWDAEDLTQAILEDYSIDDSQLPKDLKPFNPSELDL